MSSDYEFPFFSTEMSDEERGVYDEVSKLPLAKLIAEFDKVDDGEIVRDRLRYDVLQGVISDRLGLVHRDWFGPIFATELDELGDRITQLENKFKNHRHDTSKLYSGKPE